MAFLTEPEPQRGVLETIMPGISRVVAANPGRMTYHGTNTYLIKTPEGLVILDPGPEEHPEHVEALLRAVGGMRPLPLMEDVDLVRRIGSKRLVALDASALTSAARWQRDGWTGIKPGSMLRSVPVSVARSVPQSVHSTLRSIDRTSR